MPEIVEQKRKQKVLNSFLSKGTDLTGSVGPLLDQELGSPDSAMTPFVSPLFQLTAQNVPNLRELDIGSITCLRIGQDKVQLRYSRIFLCNFRF